MDAVTDCGSHWGPSSISMSTEVLTLVSLAVRCNANLGYPVVWEAEISTGCACPSFEGPAGRASR